MAPVTVVISPRPTAVDLDALPLRSELPALAPYEIAPIGDDLDELLRISMCNCNAEDDNPY